MSDVLRQTAVAIALVFMLWSNLGGGGRAGGDDTPEMYTSYPTAFSPAPYTFAVWAPIFLGCIALTVFQGLPSMRHDPRFHTLGWLVALAFLYTGATAYTPIGVSNVAITGLLVSLALAYRLAARAEPQTTAFVWCVRIPLAIFVAWTTVATILNGCQLAVSLGWPVGAIPAAVLVGVAAAAGVWGVLQYREAAIGLVLVWAFWGIVAARPGSPVVLVAASVGTLALLAAVISAAWGMTGRPTVPGN